MIATSTLLALSLLSPLAAATGDDVIFDAMQAELSRSMKNLRLENSGPPYRMSLAVIDMDLHLFRGTWGQVLSEDVSQDRSLHADVRIGSYDDDSARFGHHRGVVMPLVVEDDPVALRHAMWLGVDRAYKTALQQMSQKEAWRANRQADAEKPADYTSYGPHRHLEDISPLKVDGERARGLAKKLSHVFRQHQHIQDAVVEVGVWRKVRRYLDSEGNQTRTVQTMTQVEVVAKARSVDDEPLADFRTFYAASLDELPSDEHMVAQATRMAHALSERASAEKVKAYDGPVLFEGEASAQLLRALVVDHLGGTPPPPPKRSFSTGQSALTGKVGRRILPRGWTVVDDPARKKWGKTPLLGGFAVDEEGVVAQKVKLVNNGMLKTMLMSRVPSKKFKKTNGHGRAAPSGPVAARPGNVVFHKKGGVAQKALRKKLLRLARDEGYAHAFIIRRLSDPGVQGPLGTQAATRHLFGGQEAAVPVPIEIVRVDLAGREVPVRAAELKNLRIRDLRQLKDVGREFHVYNFMNPALHLSGPGAPAGSGPNTSLPTSIVAPSLILPMVEIKPLELEKDNEEVLERAGMPAMK